MMATDRPENSSKRDINCNCDKNSEMVPFYSFRDTNGRGGTRPAKFNFSAFPCIFLCSSPGLFKDFCAFLSSRFGDLWISSLQLLLHLKNPPSVRTFIASNSLTTKTVNQFQSIPISRSAFFGWCRKSSAVCVMGSPFFCTNLNIERAAFLNTANVVPRPGRFK